MGFFVFGVSHKQCPVEVREKFYFTAQQTTEALRDIAAYPGISEIVLLSTCNRTEFYGYADDIHGAEAQLMRFLEQKRHVLRAEFEPYFYRQEGREAVLHLFRVASGLDSLVVGENEILGQLREAFRLANQCRSVHSLLYRLIEKSLKTGKDTRFKTKINEGAVSIPSVAVELAEKIFGHLSGEKVMVLGTGEMGALTLKNLKQSGADIQYVVSRHREPGEQTAMEFGATWIPLEEWSQYAEGMDILIASTAAPHVLIEHDAIAHMMKKRRHRPLFMIDISVPRNIDARINTLDDVYLYNVDDLKGVAAANLKLRRREIETANTMVEEAVLSFQSWMEQLAARPTMERYEQFINKILEHELEDIFRQTGMSEEQKKAACDRLRARLMHPPLEKIKEASRNGGVARYLEALHALFQLDKAEEKKH